MCVGPTGTGKTLTIADKLTTKMPKEFLPEFIVFSAKTSANQTQDLIDGKLDKRLNLDIFTQIYFCKIESNIIDWYWILVPEGISLFLKSIFTKK